jgi:hypothetical protein
MLIQLTPRLYLARTKLVLSVNADSYAAIVSSLRPELARWPLNDSTRDGLDLVDCLFLILLMRGGGETVDCFVVLFCAAEEDAEADSHVGIYVLSIW